MPTTVSSMSTQFQVTRSITAKKLAGCESQEAGAATTTVTYNAAGTNPLKVASNKTLLGKGSNAGMCVCAPWIWTLLNDFPYLMFCSIAVEAKVWRSTMLVTLLFRTLGSVRFFRSFAGIFILRRLPLLRKRFAADINPQYVWVRTFRYWFFKVTVSS